MLVCQDRPEILLFLVRLSLLADGTCAPNLGGRHGRLLCDIALLCDLPEHLKRVKPCLDLLEADLIIYGRDRDTLELNRTAVRLDGDFLALADVGKQRY